MATKLVTIKQCNDPAEAAFFAGLLEDQGIVVENTAEKMGAWTGRYSLLARGPRLRVHQKDAARARSLIANPPGVADLLQEESDVEPEKGWTWEGPFTQCPLCGSSNLHAVPANLLLCWALTMLSFGFCRPSEETLWICRDCDWDSRRFVHAMEDH